MLAIDGSFVLASAASFALARAGSFLRALDGSLALASAASFALARAYTFLRARAGVFEPSRGLSTPRAVHAIFRAHGERGRALGRALRVALVLPLFVLAPGTLAHAQWTRRLELARGAFVHESAPEAIAHAARLDRGPLRLVLFLHGYRGCAEVLAARGPARCRPGDPVQPGWDLLTRHDEADTGTLFVIAQLALDARDGSPGALGRAGGFRAFLDELLGALTAELGGERTARDLASITIVAHSAAYETALALIRSDVPIAHVVLLDALYRGGAAFLAWAAGDSSRRLISMHTGAGATGRRNRDLARRARARLSSALIETESSIAIGPSHRVAIVRTRTPHREFPARHLAPVLRALLAG